MIPEHDAESVRQWAHDRTPPEYRDQVRVEVDETHRGLTIYECRRPFSDLVGPEWSRLPVARLNYVKKREEWTLYRFGGDSKFHRFDEIDPTSHVCDLLAEIDANPYGIFWG